MAQKDIIIFHNCENLFYPTNDTLTQDNDFTSEGKKHWTFERYKKKYNLLAVMKDDDVFLCHDDIWKHTKE